MEKTILQQLFNGKIAPYERMMIGNTDFLEINHELSEKQQQLQDKLPVGEQGLIDELENLYMQSSQMEMEEAFSRGFKLAGQLICSAFSARETPPPEKE